MMHISGNGESGPVMTALGMFGAAALALLVLMSIFDTAWPAETEGNAVRLAGSEPGAESRRWGVQVAGSFSESRALATYLRLQKLHPKILAGQVPMIVRKPNPSFGPQPMVHIRIPAPSREAANDLCQRLRARRGTRIVLRK